MKLKSWWSSGEEDVCSLNTLTQELYNCITPTAEQSSKLRQSNNNPQN